MTEYKSGQEGSFLGLAFCFPIFYLDFRVVPGDTWGLSRNLYEGVYRNQKNGACKIQWLACASRVSNYLDKYKSVVQNTELCL